MKNKRGITLIALIITIIVMLILVAVTINVAIQNGLFSKAKVSAETTEVQKMREQIISSLALDNNGFVIIGDTKTNLQNLFGSDISNIEETENSMSFVLKGVNGSYYCTVDRNAHVTVTKGNPGSEVVPISNEDIWQSNGNGTYTKGTETVTVGQTIYTYAQIKEKLGVSELAYKGNWMVIGTEGAKLKLVSQGNVVDVTLGKDDPVAIANSIDTTDLGRAIYSYQNAKTTLNSAAQTATGIPTARSINFQDIENLLQVKGEDAIEKNTNENYGRIFEYFYDPTEEKVCLRYKENEESDWSENVVVTQYRSQIFVDKDGKKKVIDSEVESGENSAQIIGNRFTATLTTNQKTAIGNLSTNSFFLESPCVGCNTLSSSLAYYYMHKMESGNIATEYLFNSSHSASSNPVRSSCCNFFVKIFFEY